MGISPKKIHQLPITHEKMLSIISYQANVNKNYNDIPTQMAIAKRQIVTSVDEAVEKFECLFTGSGVIK